MDSPLPAVKVLAIDDEPFQLKLLAQQFKSLGVARIETCALARTALARLQTDPRCADLVCCDLQMPDIDGIEFVRHLGQTGYQGALVLISGEDRGVLQAAQRLARSHGLRLCGAFHKPVQQEQLRQALAEAIGRVPLCRTAAGDEPVPPQMSASELAAGIERGELVNHYQPKVDFATGRWVGVETLVRWQHPRHGLVLPDRFIGLAEDAGLIDRLTHAVLFGPSGALQDAAKWFAAGLALKVSVNVSMDNLQDRGFPDVLARCAAAAGLPHSMLTVEVTESRVMKDAQAALDILTRLRLKRIGVSIDDFGTGHSTLSQLLELPFDELKIDRSFVSGASRDAALRAIVSASLEMARQFGIATVAEGVEDIEDWHFFRRQGCTLAQGYFIARPMPPEALLLWHAQWEQRYGNLLLPPEPESDIDSI